MRASYNWLRSLIPQLTASPEEVARLFTGAGLEVEGIHHYGEAAERCVVARVVESAPHPERSGLKLVTVDLGGKQQTVVCGAPNVPTSGGLVVLAPLGTVLPAKSVAGEPFVVASRTIAGVLSEGMLCSEAELGLSSEGEGIMILAEGSASPGAPLTAVLPEASDTIFEIGLTPNRADGLGHVGLARELAALLDYQYKRNEPAFPTAAADAPAAETLGATVRIDAAERCSQFATAIVQGVRVEPSPAWLRYRLASLGVRSISNVVDVTNLVMLEWGHPMHAYDLDALTPLPTSEEHPARSLLAVRHAAAGEVLETLDGEQRTLDADDVVIADGKGAVGLAGVMGGASSEVRAESTNLLLECAVFDARGVRRCARRHGMHTEASHRFERGVDASDVELVLASAAQHLVRLAGGKVAKGVLHAGGLVRFPRHITLRQARMDALLGLSVAWREAITHLERLGLVITEEAEGSVTFEVPAHRHDLNREVDLIEEVIRMHGIDRVPARLPRMRPTRDVGGLEAYTSKVRGVAVAQGLSEAVLLSLSNAQEMEKAGAPAPSVLLKNPLTHETGGLITSVVPGLLEAVARASRHGVEGARLFAVQTVFQRKGPGELPDERLAFAAVLTGPREAWLQKPSAYDVWDAKGLAAMLLRDLGIECTLQLNPPRSPLFHPRGHGAFVLTGSAAGSVAGSAEAGRVAEFGLLHPDVASAFELSAPAIVVTLDVDALRRYERVPARYQPLPRFPASPRDVAVVVREGLAAGEVEKVLSAEAGPLAESIQLFDRYAGAGVPEGHVSLAFRIVYRKPDGTLTDAEVDGVHTKVVAEVQSRFGATLRA